MIVLVALSALTLAGAVMHRVVTPPTVDVRVDIASLYDPVRAETRLPSGYRALLPRDAIFPIYAPEFVDASQVLWDTSTLVVGIEINGDARAYPVSYLNQREIVNDHVGSTPVLVTW